MALMTVPVRIIPRLDIKGPHLVKGVNLEGLRVLGDPAMFAQQYADDGADEIIYIDVVASLYGRNSALELVRSTTRSIHLPVTVGGGVRNVDDVRNLLRSGADKVAVNSEAVRNPSLVSDLARAFGSSTIVVSINYLRNLNGLNEVMIDGGRQPTGLDALGWATHCSRVGAGEILLNCIDHDGTGKGFDLDIASKASDSLEVPVVISGGAGSIEDFALISERSQVGGVCASSVFHYNLANSLASERLLRSTEGNLDFLKKSGTHSKVQGLSIADVKNALVSHGVYCRPTM